MTAAALLTLDARVAGAFVNCSISANACIYGPDGQRWFVLNARHRTAPRAASVTTEGSRSSSTDHGWGCGATDGATAKGRSWGYGNRTAATYRALAECSRKTARACHIISCSAAIHSQAEVPLAWYNNP